MWRKFYNLLLISARKDLNTWANSSQVQQVIEMGFSRTAVYAAIQAIGKSNAFQINK